MKSPLALFIVLVCSGIKALPVEDIVEAPSQYDNSLSTGAGRSWGSELISKPLGLVKKVFGVDPLVCEGLACSSCLTLLSKQACFAFAYNGEEGEKAKLDVEFQMDGKRVIGTSLNAGRTLPSCASLPVPLRRVCVGDFSADLAKGGTLSGSVCFKLTFQDRGFACRLCAAFADGRLQPSIQPEIIQL